MATVRRPTYLFVEWTAPPSPFSGNYRLTYGPNDTMVVVVVTSGTSYNITGLMPFTNYRVSVEASNVPVVEFGPALSGVFATLPDATIPPGVEAPTLVVPQVGAGSSGIVEITIPSPPFQRQDFLRYISSSVHALRVDPKYCIASCVNIQFISTCNFYISILHCISG